MKPTHCTPTSRRLLAALLCLPGLALAHTGHGEHGFLDGFSHPFLGVDHLSAMLLVGIWSLLHTRRIWLAPLVFMAGLALGALVGQQGVVLPQIEPLLAISVLAFGLMLARPARQNGQASLAVIAGFAIFHGLAHGSELPSGSDVLLGLLAGSALLHGIGLILARAALHGRAAWAMQLGRLAMLLGSGLLVNSLI